MDYVHPEEVLGAGSASSRFARRGEDGARKQAAT